jgi:hypothetical protein
MSDLKELMINEDESIEDYKMRLGLNKDLYKLTWNDIADIVNELTGKIRSESWYRKQFQGRMAELNRTIENTTGDAEIVSDEEDRLTKLTNILREIKLEKVKLSDERIQNNAYLRRISREETLKEIASDVANKMRESLPLISDNEDIILPKGKKSAVLLISDWHYGIEFDNFKNSYNTFTALRRIKDLQCKVIDYCKFHSVDELYILNLGDMISGRIHSQIRIENRIDVITQTIEVSEILCEFINNIHKHIPTIHYASCNDNHSRIEPNKKDSLQVESLSRIIDWYIPSRLEYIICDGNDKYGDDIIEVDVRGHKVLGVHGHKDKISTLIQGLTSLTKSECEMICSAHLHHFSTDEDNGVIRVSNGTLMGTDNYSLDLRCSSSPSQNLIIVTDENVMEALYRIVL